jgi:hypothetical protein
MVKIVNDKYYTPVELAKKLIETTFRELVKNGYTEITDIIEPSAGNGAFSNQIKCTAYDIEPEADGIIKADFLQVPIEYKKGRLCIGNPPFGHSNSGSVNFFNKCCEIGDYIGFIQPISQLNNNLQMYQFDLIYSEDLGEIEYSDRKLRCCYNIFIRPKNGQLNPKPDFRLKDITIIEHRRKKGEYQTGANKEISPDFDYAICNFGNSCFGKVPEYVGQYANELYFYCHKKEFLPKMLELLEFNKVREFAQSIAMKKMSMMRFYKYLGENIEGIE